MYLITNRQLYRDRSGVEILGPEAYHEDSTRLRMLHAAKRRGRWVVKLLPDTLDDAMKKEVGIDDPGTVYASRYVMAKLRAELKRRKRNLLFFIHGYNNDMKAVLDRAADLEENYKVSVLVFTWPARGGGLRGTLSYRSDKSAAEESTPALERVLERFGAYVREIEDEREQRLIRSMDEAVACNSERRDECIVNATEKECPFHITMMAHSMGCYLVRKIFEDFTPAPDFSFLDNIVLLAADTNNPGHGAWVNQLSPRQGVYVTVNRNDGALGLSERKLGRKQRERLGRLPRNFESETAVYVDFTRLGHIRSLPASHAYFEGKAIGARGNPLKVKKFFRAAFHGKPAEDQLTRCEAANIFRV